MPLLPAERAFGWIGRPRVMTSAVVAMEGLQEVEKEKKGKVKIRTLSDLSGLALKWDDASVVRGRMRKGLNLVVHYDSKTKTETNWAVANTLKNVKVNAASLRPVCQLICAHRMIPEKDSLAGEVTRLYAMNSQPINPQIASSQAWSLRYLIGVLRGTMRSDKHGKTKKILPKDIGFEKPAFFPCT